MLALESGSFASTARLPLGGWLICVPSVTYPTQHSGIRDNHRRGVVADFLQSRIEDGSRLSVGSAYFTIYAYDKLRQELDRIEHLDFLFGEPSFVNRLDPDKTEKKPFIIDADGLTLANRLQQKRVAKDCADWIGRKVDIKTVRQSNLLHGKMYHVAASLLSDRDAVLPTVSETPGSDGDDFDPVTWLVILAPAS